MKIEVVENISERIDQYLAKKLDISRSKIQKLINSGKIIINENKVNCNYKILLNDIIFIDDKLDFDINIKGEDIPLDIVYEDDNLMVINKKSGMVTHPAPGNYEKTLVNALLGRFSLSNDPIRPGIVHRLDKDTSGLMIVAKNDYTHDLLAKMIKNREVKRTYLALVNGCFSNETGTIDAPIGRDPNNRLKMMVTDSNAKNAITDFKVIKRYDKYTLIECNLRTGRTHQIRVHMAYINHPIVNDPLYGKTIIDKEFGQLLHSEKISFINPITKKELSFKVDAPQEFYNILNKICNK